MNEEELLKWFRQKEWKEGWQPEPDASIDIAVFASNYLKNTERWRMAFCFLAENDLHGLAPGRYPIKGEEVFAMVSEYSTKLLQETRLEGHRKYADIQYLIQGEEKIGLGNFAEATVNEAYSEEKDIAFFSPMKIRLLHANQDVFFVFFTKDIHQPCIAAENPAPVKKVVIKVKL